MTPRYHLNTPFLLYCLLAVLIGLAAMNNQNNLLFWMFAMLVAALLVSGIVSGIMMLGLTVHRVDPRHGVVGEPMIVRYRLSNRYRFFPAFNVHIEDLVAAPRGWRRRSANRSGSFASLMRPASAWIMHVGPHDTVHGEAVFWPTRRGEAQFTYVRLRSSFPFGLLRKSITIRQPAHTLIYPRRYRLRSGVLRAITPAGLGGVLGARQRGGVEDYYGLREYRPGDSMRRIAWKRLARLDEIVCIEQTRYAPPKLRVVLNLTAAGDDEPWRAREEHAIVLAASILHAADAAGYEIGLTIAGLPGGSLPVRVSRWHTGRLMSALAAIDLAASRTPFRPSDLPDIERVGLVVIHPDRVEPSVGRPDAWHLTAGQLEQLTDEAIGWDPRETRETREAEEAA